ncbi:MAG TPA: amino acid ABC transporter ATP-binding protein [Pirellulales bacterium]|jgi:ABC-type polar amino acid transport system ATPase subunit|nr:amino acid ABC transporter ATP-binding protein [Pirellulales bacterium]
MSAAEPLIAVDRVTKRFGDRLVLDDVSVSIGAGETVAMIGPSGGGKSTLLRCMNGLTPHDDGTIRVGEHQLSAGNGRRTTTALGAVRRLMGMVFQDFQLFPHLTALENVVEAPIRVLGRTRDVSAEMAHELLRRVGLGDRAEAYPRQLSGGQKQRVAIARALAMQPRGLLCDEITSALDPELKHEVLEVLADLKSDGMTLLVVTHEIGFARRCADRVVVLAGGKIIEDGPPAEVLDNPQSPRTRQFLSNVMA